MIKMREFKELEEWVKETYPYLTWERTNVFIMPAIAASLRYEWRVTIWPNFEGGYSIDREHSPVSTDGGYMKHTKTASKADLKILVDELVRQINPTIIV